MKPYQLLPFVDEKKQWRCGYCMAPLSRYGGRCPYCGTEFEDKLLEWLLVLTKSFAPVLIAQATAKMVELLGPQLFPGRKSK